MTYFSSDYIQFFKDLAANNERDWFHANKKRYENSVKLPFYKFLEDAIQEAGKLDTRINPEVKNTVFRINRDIRFSKNKEPYKLHMSAIISPNGRKDLEFPGLYLQFGADKIWIGGGAYNLEKEKLQDIRYSLIDKPGELKKLLDDKSFKSLYTSIRGEQNKILPKEFKEAGSTEPLIFQKQFYYMAELDSSIILKDDFLKVVAKHFSAAKPINDYLEKAMFH